MIHRLKIAITALCLTLCSQTVLALGLGEVTLLSKLNQPLNAEIELLQLRDLSEEEVLIALASREDFARIGIDRPYFLTDLTFKADLSNPKKPKVIVKSKKIVQEPFLNFIVQAQWPSGKILREYTLLLDLPVFSQRQAPTISSANSAPATQAPSQVRSTPQASNRQVGDTITVAPNETLWEIARQVRPSNGYSIQQTMLALQRLNPDAFINNNINLLKKGQVLRIPDANDITNVDQQVAISNVAQQNAQWSANNDSDDNLGAQLSAVKEPASQDTASAANEGRLKLVSPEASTDNTAGKLSGAGDSQSEALKSELAVTLEELEKTSRDNTDLRTQVQSLEDQIKTLESLIDVTNEDMRALELAANKREQDLLEQQENLSAEKEAELAALKESAAQAEADALAGAEAAQALADQKTQELADAVAEQEAAAITQENETVADAADAAEAVESESSVDDLYNQAQTAQEQLIDDQSIEEPPVDALTDAPVESTKDVVEAKPEPIKAPVSKVKKTSIVDMLIDNILYIAIAFIVLIGGVLFWIQSRAKEDEDDEFDNDFDESAFMSDIPDGDQNDDTVIMGGNDASGNEDFSENEFAPSDIDADLNADGHHVEAQTTNAATESEIYISLGQFDEAENLLLDALSEDSTNLPVKLKLLEVYAAQNASVKFNEFYADVIASGEPDDIARANDLRATVDGIDDITVIDDHEEKDEGDVSVLEDVSDLELDMTENTDEIESLERGDTLPADDIVSIDDSLEQMSQSLEDNDLTELDLNLDDIGDIEDDLTLDDISHQDHTEVLNDTVDLDDALNELDLTEDAPLGDLDEVEIEVEPEEAAAPALKTLDTESLNDDDLLAATDAVSDMSLDDEMAELDAELDVELELGSDDSLDMLDENTSPISKLDADLELDLDDLDSLDDLGLDSLDGEVEHTQPETTKESETKNLSNDLSLELDDTDLDSALDVELELEQDSDKDTQESTVDVDDLSLEDLLDSSNSLDDSTDAELDDLDLDLDSLEEASESVTADDMLSELDLELDLDESDVTSDTSSTSESIDLDDEVPEVEEPEVEATEKDSPKADSADTEKSDDELVSSDDLDLDELTLELEADESTEKAGKSEELDATDIEDLSDADELDGDDDFGFLNDSDEIATKLDLARAYIDMGDRGGAKEIIDEIVEEGNDAQKKEAKELLKKLS